MASSDTKSCPCATSDRAMAARRPGPCGRRSAPFVMTGQVATGYEKGPHMRPFRMALQRPRSALTSLETRVALANHENLATTAHNLAVAMPLLGGLQRGKHLHGQLLIPIRENQALNCSCFTGLPQARMMSLHTACGRGRNDRDSGGHPCAGRVFQPGDGGQELVQHG